MHFLVTVTLCLKIAHFLPHPDGVSRCGDGLLCDSPETWRTITGPDHRLLLPPGGGSLHDGKSLAGVSASEALQEVRHVQTQKYLWNCKEVIAASGPKKTTKNHSNRQHLHNLNSHNPESFAVTHMCLLFSEEVFQIIIWWVAHFSVNGCTCAH